MRLPPKHSQTEHLPDRPQPANLSPVRPQPEEGQPDCTADTFAEQCGGTVRKRVSAHLTLFQKPDVTNPPIHTSASTSSDLGRPQPPITALWNPVKRNQEEGCNKESAEDTTPAAAPIKRGSIAARVAAFEANNAGPPTATAVPSVPARPAWVRKM